MTAPLPTLHLSPGHVQPLWAGHPWVYAQAIAKIDMPTGSRDKAPEVGDVVRVVDPQGNVLGRGFWSPRKAIPVRIVVRDETTSLDDAAWVATKIRHAKARRRAMGLPSTSGLATTGYRLLHAEGDDLPGLVLDHFGANEDGRGGVVVAQAGTAGLYARSKQIIEALRAEIAPDAIIDRTSEVAARGEGFSAKYALAYGDKVESLSFTERGLRFSIPSDVHQKTGFYFDQRALRERVEALANGRRVLDTFCYVGPIALSAKRGGATSVLAIDDSLRALEVGQQAATENGLDVEFTRGDVRKELPRLAAEGNRFDMVVLDPPKLAPTRGDREGAGHYMAKLVEAASAVLSPNGILVVCSCSTAVGMNDLARSLAIGARRAGRSATVLERLGQGADHPVPAAFPEGVYLSTLIAELGGEHVARG